MNLNVENLKANVNVLEERIKKINSRLYVEDSRVRFKTINNDNQWFSVKGLYDMIPGICTQESVPNDEWDSIPHNLILKTVKEWQVEFGIDKVNVDDIPDLKHNQLRLNIDGDLCLLVHYNSYDDDIRAWNLSKSKYEEVAGIYYVDTDGEHYSKAWKKHLPKVVMRDANALQGVVEAFQV